MKQVIVAALLMASCAMAMPADKVESQFRDFKVAHGKTYATPAEEAKRLQIFAENMKRAEVLQASNPLATFGANAFADLSPAEFKSRHNAQRHYAAAAARPRDVLKVTAAQKAAVAGQAIDWRTKGAVTPVKNQGQCGSCWAFSTTGGIEGQWFLAGNTLTSLSEQELVSCDTVDSGCNGGLMDNAFGWLISNQQGQIVTEASYPYVSGNGVAPACSTSIPSMPVGAVITSYKDIEKTEAAMAAFMYTGGPLSIAVDATSWQTYTGGIMTNCISQQIDHGVLAVGFDMNNNPPYWIIKNSWATSWGENGYIRVAYGSNQCLLTSYPCTSIVSSGPAPPAPPTPAPGPTPAPTPAPAGNGTMTQMDCNDAACSVGCQNATFPLNQCLQLSGGGSATATCTPSSVTLTEYPLAQDCTGFSIPSQMPTNQCLQDESGSYFENFCNPGAARRAAVRVAKRM